MGCGSQSGSHDTLPNDGLTGWGLPVVEILFDAQSLAANQEMTEIETEGTYFRINPPLGRKIAMDDASDATLWELSEAASKYIEANKVALDSLALLLHR